MPRRRGRQGSDLDLPVEPGLQVIQGYGDRRFRIGGTVHEGSVLVLPTRTEPWPVGDAAAITAAALQPVTAGDGACDLLLVGCGRHFTPPPAGLRQALKDAGVALEWMDTGAACRTFNVLLAEGRRVAAALVAVD